jgi:hypothetical protein
MNNIELIDVFSSFSVQVIPVNLARVRPSTLVLPIFVRALPVI